MIRAARAVRLAGLAAVLALAACASEGPRDIAWGEEPCGYCRMTITDRRFGAEARTATGKVQAFDSIECLAAYAASVEGLRGVWVSDYNAPGTLVPADSATFWRLEGGASPMGKGLAATVGGRPPAGAEPAAPPMDWRAVVALVSGEGLRGGSEDAHAH